MTLRGRLGLLVLLGAAGCEGTPSTEPVPMVGTHPYETLDSSGWRDTSAHVAERRALYDRQRGLSGLGDEAQPDLGLVPGPNPGEGVGGTGGGSGTGGTAVGGQLTGGEGASTHDGENVAPRGVMRGGSDAQDHTDTQPRIRQEPVGEPARP